MYSWRQVRWDSMGSILAWPAWEAACRTIPLWPPEVAARTGGLFWSVTGAKVVLTMKTRSAKSNWHIYFLVWVTCVHLPWISISKSFSHPQPGPSRATNSHPRGLLPMGVFFLFFPLMTTLKKTVQTTFSAVTYMFFPENPRFFFLNVFTCFCKGFLQNTIIYTFVAMNPFQNIMLYNVSSSLISPNFWR